LSPDLQPVAVVLFKDLLGFCVLLDYVVGVALVDDHPCMSFTLSC